MEKGFKKAGEACFWAALFIELVIVVIEKSAYTNPYESLVFRLTFLLFCIKILSTKYTRGEWLVIILCGGLAVLSYWINERDETVRAAVLVPERKWGYLAAFGSQRILAEVQRRKAALKHGIALAWGILMRFRECCL